MTDEKLNNIITKVLFKRAQAAAGAVLQRTYCSLTSLADNMSSDMLS